MVDVKQFCPVTTQSGEGNSGTLDPQILNPIYPKSLYLVNPLFSSSLLQNSLNKSDNTLVIGISPINLNEWIVPSVKPIADEILFTETILATEPKTKVKSTSKGKSKGKRKESGLRSLTSVSKQASQGVLLSQVIFV
jgi:hypothetical protein